MTVNEPEPVAGALRGLEAVALPFVGPWPFADE